ncbi:class I SAM-dependent methyltransferase [Chloroflexota bacterium]
MISKRFRNNGKPTAAMNELKERMKKQVEEKVANGIYSFESPPCCLCGQNDFQLLSEKDRYGLCHPVVICRDCGLVQANPRMTQESYKQFYEIEYRKLYMWVDTPTDEFFKLRCEHGGEIYQYLTENLTRKIKGYFIVEVGCASGGVLQYFREKGNEIYGVDLDGEYIEFGRANYNLNLEVGTIDNVIGLGRSPDIVIFSHVLEHLSEPISELRKLRLIMGDNSFLYIELPGNKNIARSYQRDFLRLLTNSHVCYFNQTTLRNLLRKAGYEFVCGDEAIYSIFRKSSAADTELDTGQYNITNDYAEAVAFFRRLEFSYSVAQFYKNMRALPYKTLVNFLKIVGLYNFARKIYHRVKSN